MNKRRITAGILAATGILLAMPATAAIKCWTNNEGVRECGNVVPPEYAQDRTSTLNERGVVLEVKERAKTKEELAAERAREAEEKRRMVEEEERRQKQQAYDRVLLNTFTTEEELVDSRDRKLASIAATIEVTRASIGKLEENMGELRRRAANLERTGKPIPDEIKHDLANLQQQVDNKQSFIAGREQEMDQLRAQYDADIQRFRRLKGSRR